MSGLRVQKSNLHSENCTAAGGLEKELEAARTEEKSLARSDCCPGKRVMAWARVVVEKRKRTGWT